MTSRKFSYSRSWSERIFIRADRHVRYRQFMDVINQLQRDGYYKIGLISEEVQGG